MVVDLVVSFLILVVHGNPGYPYVRYHKTMLSHQYLQIFPLHEWGLGNICIIVFYVKMFEGPITNPPDASFWESSAQDIIYQVMEITKTTIYGTTF